MPRITPACAGITGREEGLHQGSQDHPRVCGNYACLLPFGMPMPGSPPRVRELLKQGQRDLEDYRITPACAGITKIEEKQPWPNRDHPRVCGNYLRHAIFTAFLWGSPPRVRELPKHHIIIYQWYRITPACAGITLPVCNFEQAARDHPRVCGNYMNTYYGGLEAEGSPPRVRELLCHRYRRRSPLRITPACAGITLKDPFKTLTLSQ